MKIFGLHIFFIILFTLLLVGKLYCQLEENHLTYGFDINDKISIGLKLPKVIQNNRYSDYTIPYRYGIRNDSISISTTFFVIDTISKNDFKSLVLLTPIDSVRTKYGQSIKLYKWLNYNKYDFFINGILIIDDKIIILSYFSNVLNDFKTFYELYKSIISTLVEYKTIEIPEVIED